MTTTPSHTDWISVAGLEKGFATGSYALDNSADLTGKQVELHAADGTVRRLEFDQEQLSIDGGEAAKVRITSSICSTGWMQAPSPLRPTP